jgi:hypothetical protein
MLEEIIERLSSPEKVSIFLFTLGFSLIIAATGIIRGLKFLGLSAPSPRSKKKKLLMGTAGGVLVISGVALSLSLPVYKPDISSKVIYAGRDAKQIVADGEDVYLLKDNGNIFRISQNRLELVDPGTGTAQISPAGGTLYILKDDGNIWSYLSVSGRVPTEEGSFQPKYPETRTKQIVSAGADLYILKENGNIWKFLTRPAKRNMNSAQDEWIWVDDGTNTREIASTGSILYVLKESGDIWQYIPTHMKYFGRIYKAESEDKKAISIACDGGTLYFIRNDGSTWKYKESLKVVEKDEVAKEIETVGGILYILTNKGEVIRYNTNDDDLRKLTKADSDNVHIAAFGQDVFVIKKEGGGVWRYNEYIRKR